MTMEITLAVLPVLAALIGWGMRLAYRAGVVLTALEQRLQLAERRISALEKRSPPTPVPSACRIHAPPP